MLRHEIGVCVVYYSSDERLLLCICKGKVWCRKRNDLDIDPDPIHVLETFRDIGHGRRHPKEARGAISDDRLTGRTLAERKLGRDLTNTIEIDRRVIVCVQIELENLLVGGDHGAPV